MNEGRGGARDVTTEIRETVALASRVLAAAGQGDLVWGHASARARLC